MLFVTTMYMYLIIRLLISAQQLQVLSDIVDECHASVRVLDEACSI